MFSRQTATFLILLMILGVVACGEEQNVDGEPVDYVYRSTTLSIPNGIDSVEAFTVSDNQLYVAGWCYSEDSGHVFTLYGLHLDGTVVTETNLPLTLAEGSIEGICPDGLGGVWLCLNQRTFTQDEESLLLSVVDEQTDLFRIDTEGMIVDTRVLGNISIMGMAADENGNIFLLSGAPGTQTISVYASDGEKLFTASCGGLGNGLIRVGSEVCLTDSSRGLLPIDIESQALGDVILDGISTQVYGGEDGAIYYTESSGVTRQIPGEKSGTQVLVWSDVNISSAGIQNVIVLEDHTIVCSFYGNTELAVLVPEPSDMVDGRLELTLATVYTNQLLEQAIVQFNQSNDEYRVVLVDYSQYNTEEDNTAGLLKLQTEILAGNLPDLLCLNGLQVDLYTTNELLRDLYPYMDRDNVLTREAMVPNLRQALEEDGKLYTMPTHFGVQTVVGATEETTSGAAWTPQMFLAYATSLPEGVSALSPYTNRDALLQTLVDFNLNELIDWDTGILAFDSQWFIDLMTYCESLVAPDEIIYPDDEPEPYELVASGVQRLTEIQIGGGLEELEDFYNAYGGDMDIVGYPTGSGVDGSAFALFGELGISATTDHDEAAWSFISLFVQMESWNDLFYFSVMQDRLEEQLENAADPITGVQQNVVDFANSLIRSTKQILRQDQTVWAIVEDEIQTFYSGDKTAEATATVINQRVQIYVQEYH